VTTATAASASRISTQRPAVARANLRARARLFGQYALLSLAALVVLFPLLLALSYSFMSEADTANYPPRLLPSSLQLDNYQRVLASVPLLRYLLNSFISASLVVIGQLFTASLAAFAFAFLVFPGRNLLFGLFLATMMIPWEAIIIPNYMTVRSLGWLDTYQGLSVPFMAQAFGTFLLRQSFLQLPRDLFDAAVVDGASKLRFLWTIVLPLSRPALATLAVYAFLWTWNLYFWPLLITNDPLMRTTQVGIGQLRFEETLRWGYVMAGVTMIVLPTLLLLVIGQRHLVRGLTAGAVKG
jgi:sn-glycerol 3-phosphate transport system permease protein